jgi:hypothetical protein
MTSHHRGPIQHQPTGTAATRLAASNGSARSAIPSDRAQRFLTRLDTHLPIIADRPARRAFLDRQLEGWEHRYARFIATAGASEPGADAANPPQAADFLLTIVGLAARRSAIARDER